MIRIQRIMESYFIEIVNNDYCIFNDLTATATVYLQFENTFHMWVEFKVINVRKERVKKGRK